MTLDPAFEIARLRKSPTVQPRVELSEATIACYVEDMERGVREDMTVSTAKKLAAALGVSLAMLVGDVESELEPAALVSVSA
jgi:hypothetical protein